MATHEQRIKRLEEKTKSAPEPENLQRAHQICVHHCIDVPRPLPGEKLKQWLRRVSTQAIRDMLAVINSGNKPSPVAAVEESKNATT